MQIIHRISISATRRIRQDLASLGIVKELVTVLDDLVLFELAESDDRWPDVRLWIARHDALDIVTTRFSAAEIAGADWLVMSTDRHHGYRQPEDNYMEVTYDLADYCSTCGIGAKQNAPFHMKSEPRWGRNGILQLNWVFDEFFAKPEIWDAIFKPRGVGCRPVLDARDRELKTVIQLVVEEEVDILIGGLTPVICASCGRVKYEPAVRGPFPPIQTPPSGHSARARAYFGSGRSAHKAVLVSQQLREAFTAAKTRGAAFEPVAKDAL